ncbi:sulfur-oxidizing protein SoxY [Gammaproteobacteria bacterium]
MTELTELTEPKRRIFLKGSLLTGTLGAALGSGLLTPERLLAEWSKEAFSAKEIDKATAALDEKSSPETSDKITLTAPDIAENGAVVPVTVETTLPDVSRILLFSEKNIVPLVADFRLPAGTDAYVSTRIKMAQTGSVVAIVKSGKQLFTASREVKVTTGGCGG